MRNQVRNKTKKLKSKRRIKESKKRRRLKGRFLPFSQT